MFKIDTTQVKALAGLASRFPEAIARAEYRAVNKVAEKTLTRSKREIVSRVKLSAGYVRDRMFLKHASLGRAVATIQGRSRATRLATFGAKQLTAAAPKAKGDAMRGIPAGRKQAGIAVYVDPRKGRKRMPGAFFIPLKSSNGMGMFWRYGPGKKDIEHLYGPSVDQVFSSVIVDFKDDVVADVEATFSKQLDFELKGLK